MGFLKHQQYVGSTPSLTLYYQIVLIQVIWMRRVCYYTNYFTLPKFNIAPEN